MKSSYDMSSDVVRISFASMRRPRAISVLGCAAATLMTVASAVLRCDAVCASASTSSTTSDRCFWLIGHLDEQGDEAHPRYGGLQYLLQLRRRIRHCVLDDGLLRRVNA